MIFDVLDLGPAWLGVSIAASDDELRPILYRSVALEFFASGVRLVSTDSYIMLSAWVPALGEGRDEPDLDEAPERIVVAQDPSGRAKSLVGYLTGLASKKDAPRYELELQPDAVLDDHAQLDGFSMPGVAFEHPEHERLIIPVAEGEYPNWRRILADAPTAATEHITLSASLLGRIAKAAKPLDAAVALRFAGVTKMAQFDLVPDLGTGGRPPIVGAIMPIAEVGR